MPILFNEDDHYDFDKPNNNFLAALSEGASWGYFDFRRQGEGFEHGFQSVPVDWKISSPRKTAFFAKLKEITQGGAKDERPKRNRPTGVFPRRRAPRPIRAAPVWMPRGLRGHGRAHG
jgi:hypothetical protein